MNKGSEIMLHNDNCSLTTSEGPQVSHPCANMRSLTLPPRVCQRAIQLLEGWSESASGNPAELYIVRQFLLLKRMETKDVIKTAGFLESRMCLQYPPVLLTCIFSYSFSQSTTSLNSLFLFAGAAAFVRENFSFD